MDGNLQEKKVYKSDNGYFINKRQTVKVML